MRRPSARRNRPSLAGPHLGLHFDGSSNRMNHSSRHTISLRSVRQGCSTLLADDPVELSEDFRHESPIALRGRPNVTLIAVPKALQVSVTSRRSTGEGHSRPDSLVQQLSQSVPWRMALVKALNVTERAITQLESF